MPPNTQDPDAYSALLVSEFGTVTQAFLRNYDILRADGEVAAAELMRRAYSRLRADVERIALEVSRVATEAIKKAEAESRVRPDTGGDNSGHRLTDYVGESYPLTDVPGSVGVNFEPLLYENVPWWWTNEEGYSGHIGRVVHGFFYDAGYTSASRPDPGEFRQHPLFRAEGPQRPDGFDRQHALHPQENPGKGVRPGMLIRNPIPAREFVLKGVREAETEWHRRMVAAKARFDGSMAEVLALLRVPQAP